MEFSKYVLDVLSAIECIVSDYDTDTLTLLGNASKKAPSKSETHILDTIAGIVTMRYNSKERTFGPHAVWSNGMRTFALEDIQKNDLDILCSVVDFSHSNYLRTKFSHIIWLLTKGNRYGEIAVRGYIYEFETQFDTENWVECYEQIRSAYHISITMGQKSECFKKTKSAINQKLLQMKGCDTLFLSIKLLGLIVKDIAKDELLMYDSLVSNLIAKNMTPNNNNSNLADATFSIAEKFYRRLSKDDDIKKLKVSYAIYYESQAKSLANNNDYFRAVTMIKKSCGLYVGISKEKLLELRLLMEDWQKKALLEMHFQEFEFDLKPVYEIVEKKFEALSLQEAIVQFGRISRIYTIEDVKNNVIKKQKQEVFTSLFGYGLLNDSGQTVAQLPSISEVSTSENPEAMKQHMIRYVVKKRKSRDVFWARIAFQFLQRYCPISEEALDFIVYDNAIIPEKRIDIIRQGLCLALNGNLYAAMHILQPQIENIFRNLVRICGDTVTFLKENGTEEYKPLSALFNSEKLCECYDENIIFTFQSFMDGPAGENLRNLNAHGLLEPDFGNSDVSLCFVSLIIYLLSLYGMKSYSILSDLVKRDRLYTNAHNEIE